MKNYACLALLVALAACGSQSSATPSGKSYSASIVSNGQTAPVSAVLYSSQFIAPFTDTTTLTVGISPQPSTSPGVTWSAATPNIVTLSPADPRQPGTTAPPGGTFAIMTQKLGVSKVSAAIGPPVNQTLSINVYTYGSIVLRCQFRYQPAYSFDPGSSPRGLSSDLFATEPAGGTDPFDPCTNTVFAIGPSAVHFPYGGVIIPASATSFLNVVASQWQNAAIQSSEAALLGATLLFKTQRGLIVKAVVPLGPFEVSDATGQFPY
ncbi:MAG: hypothetical protein ABI282_10935 [Candidatus Baltobacteraceae bacterium]